MTPVDPPEVRRFALEAILAGFARMDAHPFGAKTDERIERIPAEYREHCQTMYLVHPPGSTGTVARGLAMITKFIALDPDPDNAFRYLRRFRNTGHPLSPIYFEVGSNVGVFFCCGGSPIAGVGGQGYRQLQSIFEFLSIMHSVPIKTEKVSIDMLAVLRTLTAVWNRDI